MNDDDLYYPTLIVWILQMIGMLCLLLAIPTFLISKVLRTHPGSLILMCCIVEFIYYYTGFLVLSATLNHFNKIDFDIIAILIPTINTLTFGIIQLNQKEIYIYLTAVTGTCVFILEAYNICLSLDIILIIRNPLYSPSRRVYLYHFCCIFFPLTIIFITSLMMNVEYIFDPHIDNNQTKYLGLALVIIGVIIATILFAVGSGTLIFSFHKIKKLVLESKQKRILLWKILIYQIFALIYSFCLMVLNISVILLTIYMSEEEKSAQYMLLLSVRNNYKLNK